MTPGDVESLMSQPSRKMSHGTESGIEMSWRRRWGILG